MRYVPDKDVTRALHHVIRKHMFEKAGIKEVKSVDDVRRLATAASRLFPAKTADEISKRADYTDIIAKLGVSDQVLQIRAQDAVKRMREYLLSPPPAQVALVELALEKTEISKDELMRRAEEIESARKRLRPSPIFLEVMGIAKIRPKHRRGAGYVVKHINRETAEAFVEWWRSTRQQTPALDKRS